MCEKQSAGQHWTCGQPSWRLWWTWMAPSCTWCTGWGLEMVMHWLERNVRSTAALKPSSTGRAPAGTLWSSWGRGIYALRLCYSYMYVSYLEKARKMRPNALKMRETSFFGRGYMKHGVPGWRPTYKLWYHMYFNPVHDNLMFLIEFAYGQRIFHWPALSPSVIESGSGQGSSSCSESLDSNSDNTDDNVYRDWKWWG